MLSGRDVESFEREHRLLIARRESKDLLVALNAELVVGQLLLVGTCQRREKRQKLLTLERWKNGLVHLHERLPLAGLGSKALAGFERPGLDGVLRGGLQGDRKCRRLLACFDR